MSIHPLKQVGITTEQQPVVSIFELVDSRGIDFETLLTELKQADIIPSWKDYWESAHKANYDLSRKLKELVNIVSFVYGKKYAEDWLQKSMMYILWLGEEELKNENC